MADLLCALAIWLLAAMLVGWFFSRAAVRLRQPPPTRAELRAAQLRAHECDAAEPVVFDPDAVWRAVRVYEHA
jgi:hypothetical protein